MPSTPTLPATEPSMWRKLLAAAHPDRGGDHELFIWAHALRDIVCGEPPRSYSYTPPRPPRRHEPEALAVPFAGGYDFDALTARAMEMADTLEEPFAGLLKLLSDCYGVDFDPLATQQQKGATYKQLAAIGHRAGMSKEERVRWYRIAEDIPLSRRHAGHIMSRQASMNNGKE